jgi:hypothetical protein
MMIFKEEQIFGRKFEIDSRIFSQTEKFIKSIEILKLSMRRVWRIDSNWTQIVVLMHTPPRK